MAKIHRTLHAAGALATALALSPAVWAGSPLICDTFVATGAALLPWSEGRGWHSSDRAYDVERLTADTLALLTDDAPILARMENLRRATIYTLNDPRAARKLLDALLERTRATLHAETPSALAWFDAGYLIESLRQTARADMPEPYRPSAALLSKDHEALDGYGLVQRAIALGPEWRAEMEFAASLMTRDAAAAARHREHALAAVRPSLAEPETRDRSLGFNRR